MRALAWWKKRTRPDASAEDAAGELVIGLDLGDGAWWLRGDAHFDPAKPESSTNRRGDLRTGGQCAGLYRWIRFGLRRKAVRAR